MEFEKFIEKISPKLKAITHKLNGKYTFFSEEDLYQEAAVYLWQKNSKNELSDKTTSYILQGCMFHLKNHIRKIYKKIDINSVSLNGLVKERNIELDDLAVDPQRQREQADSRERDLMIKDINSILSDREKKILSLRLKGFTTREAGKRLGVSHVAIVKMEKKIKDKYLTLANKDSHLN